MASRDRSSTCCCAAGRRRSSSSRTELTAVSAPGEIARSLKIQRGDVLLRMEAYLYTKDGTAIVHSLSYFLPGTFRFHVVRRVGRHP